MHLLRRRKATSTDDIFGASYAQNHSVRGLRLLAVSSVLIILTASASAVALSRTTSPSSPSVITPADAQTRIVAQTTDTQNLDTRTAPVANVTLVPTCARGTYRLPSSVDPTNLSDGVHYQIDSPASYTVYGNSIPAIQQQIYDCTPVIETNRYAANTGFNLSTYYTYDSNSDGTCSIARATVTLHVNQIYPRWVNTGASTTLANTWNTFITNLRTHEDGHTDFDKLYAQKLYDRLKATTNVNCRNINLTAKATIKSVVTTLRSANDGYDAATNHGETQGATL